jgi:transposase
MIGPHGAVRVMVAIRPVDFRKGVEGLAALVRETMKTNPFSGAVYVFRAKRADRVKLIFWTARACACSPSGGPAPSGSSRSSRNCSATASADGPKHCLKTSCCSGLKRSNRWKPASMPGRSDRHLPKACKAAHQPGISAGHLPRVEMIVDLDDKACPCCGHALHWIGEDVSERLDIIPAQFRVVLVRRPKYACRACEEAVIQAAAPARLIEGGLSTEALVAQVLVSKYADHLPLYRQAQIYARQGIELDRSTLADWVGSAASPP